MSEDSSTGAPGAAASEDEPAPSPAAEAPEAGPSAARARGRRWVSRARGTSLRVRLTAAVAAATVIAAVVVVALPSSPPPDYTSLPAPCGGISLASLTTILPHPTGTRQSVPTDDALSQESCKWSSTADIAMIRDVLAGLPRT